MDNLGKMLNIEDYNTLTIMGLKGSGKTYGMALMALMVKNKQVWIFDTLGAFTRNRLIPPSMATYIKMAMLPKNEMMRMFSGVKTNYVILDLSAFIPKELVYIADIFAEWALKRGRMAVFVDEIVDYCPQSENINSVGLRRMWQAGRNFGIWPVVLSTQRPQEADKKLLAHSQVHIVMKLVHPLDRKKVEELVAVGLGDRWTEIEKNIIQLGKRQAYIYDSGTLELYSYEFEDMNKVKKVEGG